MSAEKNNPFSEEKHQIIHHHNNQEFQGDKFCPIKKKKKKVQEILTSMTEGEKISK